MERSHLGISSLSTPYLLPCVPHRRDSGGDLPPATIARRSRRQEDGQTGLTAGYVRGMARHARQLAQCLAQQQLCLYFPSHSPPLSFLDLPIVVCVPPSLWLVLNFYFQLKREEDLEQQHARSIVVSGHMALSFEHGLFILVLLVWVCLCFRDDGWTCFLLFRCLLPV